MQSLCRVTGTNTVMWLPAPQNKQSHRIRDPICGYGKGGGWEKMVQKYKLPVIR